jgi:hypothetical protein
MQRCTKKNRQKRCRETKECVDILPDEQKIKRTGRCPKGKSKCSADNQCYPLDDEDTESEALEDFTPTTSKTKLNAWLTAYYKVVDSEKIKNVPTIVSSLFSNQALLDTKLKNKHNKGLAFAKAQFESAHSFLKARKTPKAAKASKKASPAKAAPAKEAVNSRNASTPNELSQWLKVYYIILFPEELHLVEKIVDVYFSDQAKLDDKLKRKSGKKYKNTGQGLAYAKTKSEEWAANKRDIEPTIVAGYAQSKLELENWIETLLMNQGTPEKVKQILKIERPPVRLPEHVASVYFSHQRELDQILHAFHISLEMAKTNYAKLVKNNALQVEKEKTRAQNRKDPYKLF